MNTKWRAPRDPRDTLPPLWLLELAIFAENPLLSKMLYVSLQLFIQNGALQETQKTSPPSNFIIFKYFG